MSRHPYTHAADFIRMIPSHGKNGCVLSRSDASQIRKKIAEVIGMNDEELAIKLSNAFQKLDDDFFEKKAQDFLKIYLQKS